MPSYAIFWLDHSADQSNPRSPVSGRKLTLLTLIGIFALLLVGCAPTNSAGDPALASTAGSANNPTDAPANAVTQTTPALSTADTDAPQNSTKPMTVTITEDSLARYLVREQLARLDFPNDAIGQTSQVSGAIAFDSSGQVVSEKSRIVVNLESLISDEDRRDNFLRTRSLESSAFPTAEFMVRETPGLPWPLPTKGLSTFQLVGDMTLHGVTRPLTWDATAQFNDGTLTGQANTTFSFEDFDIEVPRLRFILSVDNNIRLELDFTGSVS